MNKLLLYTVCIFLVFLNLSCSNQKEAEERERAFEDYKNFVEETESKANTNFTEAETKSMEQPDMDTSTWQRESADMMQDYEDRKRKVEENFSAYDAAQQQEIRDLDTRYNDAYQRQAGKYREVSHRYKLRKELLQLPVAADDMSNIPAEAFAETYTGFVQQLKAKQDSLSQKDWELVEGWWLALNNRKNELDSELSATAKSSIQKATESYLQLRKSTPVQ